MSFFNDFVKKFIAMARKDNEMIRYVLLDHLWRAGTVEMILTYRPELKYWREKGLTVSQIEQWMKLTGINLDNMIQSLCHCAYEMANIENSEPVKDIFEWFFKVIEKSGYYPAPQGYQNYLDVAIRLEMEALELMNNPDIDRDLYKKCLRESLHSYLEGMDDFLYRIKEPSDLECEWLSDLELKLKNWLKHHRKNK